MSVVSHEVHRAAWQAYFRTPGGDRGAVAAAVEAAVAARDAESGKDIGKFDPDYSKARAWLHQYLNDEVVDFNPAAEEEIFSHVIALAVTPAILMAVEERDKFWQDKIEVLRDDWLSDESSCARTPEGDAESRALREHAEALDVLIADGA